MKRTSATRHEMLERNPQLKKYWLSRLLVGSILMGAKIEADEWKQVRFILIALPIVIAVFAINILYTPNMQISDYVVNVTLVVFLSLGWPLIASLAYGYKNKQRLDTTGGIKGNFKNLGRYMIWFGLIGVGISTGVGIFSWLK